MSERSTFRLRSAARNYGAVPEIDPHPGEDLADWLQEVAKRPWVAGPPSIDPALLAETNPKVRRIQRQRRLVQSGRSLVASAALAIGFLQYYYLDVMVQIGSLPKVIVFLPVPLAPA